MNAPPLASARFTLLLLFFINFLNFFDRTIPAVVLELIRKEFLLDDTMLGVLGTSFTLMYALAGLPLGRLSDRLPRTRVLSAGVFVWSLMTAASGIAWNFASFLILRLGVGIGEATCAPAANAMIGDLYPPERRARALGLFMLGLPLGTLVCFALVGPLAHKHGFRLPFFLASAPGVVAALLVLLCREPTRGSQEAYAVDASVPLDKPYRRVMSIPTLWWIILSGAAINFAAYALNTFLPALMVRYHHVDVANAGYISSLVLGATGLLGLSLGGWVADKVHEAFPRGRLMLGACSSLVSAPLMWIGLTRPAGEVASATIVLCLGWVLYFMYFVTVYSSVQDVIEPRLRATAMSLYFFFQYVLGAGFGTVVTGALSDRYAREAMKAAGAAQMSEVFRAAGLEASMSLVVPLAVLITGLALWFAAGRFRIDVARVRSASSKEASPPLAR